MRLTLVALQVIRFRRPRPSCSPASVRILDSWSAETADEFANGLADYLLGRPDYRELERRPIPPAVVDEVAASVATALDQEPEVVADQEPSTGAVDRPEVEIDDPVAESEPSIEHEQLMARAADEPVGPTLAEGQTMRSHEAETNSAWTKATMLKGPANVRKGKSGHGAVMRPDLAAEAAKLGMPVSPRAAA